MKFIGQYIQSLIARFRNDVYLEDVSTGTIVEGGNLGLDSNNKIVKAIDDTGISLANGSDNRIVTATGTSGLNAEANFTYDGTDVACTADNFEITSANTTDPNFQLTNTTDDATGPRFRFLNNRSADGQDNDEAGRIEFFSYDDGTPAGERYAQIISSIHDATSGEESGKLQLQVASHDGGDEDGLVLTGGSADAEVDVTVGNGSASVTTIVGTLTMGSTATLDNSGILQTAAQTNITSLGTLTNLQVDFINTDGSTLTITDSSDTGDLFSIATTTHGATTLRTVDDDATVAHLTLNIDGNIILDTAIGSANNGIILSSGATQFGDFNVHHSKSYFTLYEAGGASLADYFDIAVAANGATSITTVDAAGTDANLNFAIDGTFSVASTGIDIATDGTITNATWSGTAIATDQQKHLAYFEFKGYGTGDGTNYEMPEQMTDQNAPFEHNTSTGSNGLTAQTIQTVMRSGGVVMPYTGVLKKFHGWATSAGSGTVNIALFKFTPTDDTSGNLTPVQLVNESITASGNAIMNSFSETSSFDAGFSAGDIIYPAVLGIDTKTFYFNSTLVVEWS